MRIGMMADIYKPHISGVTHYIALNKKMLEAAGHEVYIFTFGDVNYEDSETNVIRSLGLPLVDTGYYLGFRHSKEAVRLITTMDLVHVHHPFLSGSLALRLCRPRAIPVVFTNHTRYDLYAQAYMPMLPHLLGDTMLQAFLPSFCRACTTVIAPSEGLRKVLTRFGVNDHNVRVLPNGVDLAPFKQIGRTQDRDQFGFAPDDIVLVYVGRLGPEKNLPFLLRSFAGTAEACPNARLLLIGGGPERESLQERVKTMGLQNLVSFTGLVPYPSLPGYLAIANVFVTASVTEVHPLSVIEAMAAGLPVLGIHSPGVGDTVQDCVTGFLSSENLSAFTANMVRLVSENELRQQMGGQAQKAVENYSIDRTVKTLMELYEELIQDAAPRRQKLLARQAARAERWRK